MLFFYCVIWTLSLLHQRVPGCSVGRLSWRSRRSSGRRGGARSDRYTLLDITSKTVSLCTRADENVSTKICLSERTSDFKEDLVKIFLWSVSTGVPQETQGRPEEAEVFPEELRILGSEVSVFQFALTELDVRIRMWRIISASQCHFVPQTDLKSQTWSQSSRSSQSQIHVLFW